MSGSLTTNETMYDALAPLLRLQVEHTLYHLAIINFADAGREQGGAVMSVEPFLLIIQLMCMGVYEWRNSPNPTHSPWQYTIGM